MLHETEFTKTVVPCIAVADDRVKHSSPTDCEKLDGGSTHVKSFESGPFRVGQKLLHCAGTKIQTVTFVSLGPRIAKGGNGAKETILGPPQTAIVRDRHDNLLTVNLHELQPLPAE